MGAPITLTRGIARRPVNECEKDAQIYLLHV